jgi:hypothetical protein
MNGLWAVIALTLQAPGDGWGMVDSRPRELKQLYWELFQTTEVWTTLSPVTGDTVAGPRFAFQAFFAGREVKGKPQRLQVKALAGGVVPTDLSLRIVTDGEVADLTGPQGSSFLLFPCAEGCAANGVVAELKDEVLRAMVGASRVEIAAFGQALRLSPLDQAALGEFAAAVGVASRSTQGREPTNKGMKLTKREHIGALQLIPGVGRTPRVSDEDAAIARTNDAL